MKKKMVSGLLCLTMLLTLLPGTAWAIEPTENDPTIYEVGTADAFAEAVAAIKANTENGTDFTIVLTADGISAGSFAGVADKHITLKSAAAARTLTLAGDTLRLAGDMTFENIHITPKTIYAQGHELVLGEGFGGGTDGTQRMIVYGGSDSDLTANTSVTVLDGVYKLISGGNSKGTLTGNTYVEFGGTAQFPTAADRPENGDQPVPEKTENYNLYFAGTYIDGGLDDIGILPYGIYGGGTVGNTEGNTEVVMTGGTVFQIFGGGASRRAQGDTTNTENLGQVSGDTSVRVTAGTVKSVYGGGYNDIYVDDRSVDASVREYRASVGGDTSVYIGGTTTVPATEKEEDNSSSSYDMPAVHGGSFHSSVQNTTVVIADDAKVESGGSSYGYGVVYGGGCNDIVRGTTSVELTGNAVVGNASNTESAMITQGKFSAITPLGRSKATRGYLGGNAYTYGAVILNEGNANYAAVAEVSGGTVDVLMAGVKNRIAIGNKANTVAGNILLKQSGGTVKSIEAGCIKPKNVTINGNVDVLVTGGTAEKYILGKYISEFSNGNTITGKTTLTFDGCGTTKNYLVAPNVAEMSEVHVKNSAQTAVVGAYNLPYAGKIPFYHVGDLTVEKGSTLALKQEANITGNLVVNGALNLSRTDAARATLTAAGTAMGAGALLPITAPASGADYEVGSVPKVNEEYVYAKTKGEGSTMALALSNSVNGLYVDQKSKSAGQDVWFIDQRQPTETITVTYQWTGGDTSKNIPKDVTLPMPDTIEKGSAYTAKQVTSTTHTFDGWYLDAAYTQKFTDGTVLDADTTLYGNWRVGTATILWYRNIYLQRADGTYPEQPGSHAQGGWVAPNSPVTISGSDFDGKQVEGYTLGQEFVYDANYKNERLFVVAALEAGKHNPLRIYYKRAPHTVTYEYEGTVPENAPEAPKKVDTWFGAEISVAVAPAMDGWTFSGWTVKTPEEITIDNGKLTMPNADVVLKGSWQKVTPTYTVTYTDGVDGEEVFADQTISGLASGEATPVFSGMPTRSGYTFTGWSPAVAATVTANATYTAQWSRNSSGGGGTTYYTLSYEPNGGTEYKDERYSSGTTVKLDKVPSRTGYAFTGWYAEQTLTTAITEVKMTSNKTVYAGWRASTVPGMLNGDDHFAYVVGYTDGTVGPLNNITRAEVATIFFRLLKDDVRDKNLTATNTFTDVVAGTWCNKPISTMTALGVVKGRSADRFDPEAAITRAEFATICARFDTTVTNGNSNFTDISGHWAQADIERAATLGWIQGYTDGTFRPEQYITRAEAMTMINRVLCRIPEDEDDLLKDMIVWPDNQPGVWYYLAVQEATNGHDYTPKGEVYERWTKLIAARDWTKYEN